MANIYPASEIPMMDNLPEVVSKRYWKLEELKRTSYACPSQWEGKDEYGRYVYIRFRHGNFTVGISDNAASAVTDNMLSPLIAWDSEGEWDGPMHDLDMLHLISEYFDVESWQLMLGA